MDRRRSVSDKPGEPEVIPPGDMRSRRASFDGAQRFYVARISPVGFAFMGVMIAVLAALFFLLLVGALVVLLPLAGLLLAIIIAVGLFRILIWRRFLAPGSRACGRQIKTGWQFAAPARRADHGH